MAESAPPREPIASLLRPDGLPRQIGRRVRVQGWLRTRRTSKDFSFLELNDGSSLSGLQVVAEAGLPGYEAVPHLNTGSSLIATGTLVASQGKGQALELKAEALTVVQNAPPDFPLQKKRHSFEFLRTISHLRVRSNTFGAVFRVRNAMFFLIHEYFQQRGFLCVQAPVITASDAEGAGAMFRVTTLDLERLRPNGPLDWSQDFFGKRASLTVSGQLEAEIFAHAFHDVYSFGPTFRAENSNTSRHAAEFWMIEPEMAFCDLAGNRALAEDFTRAVIARTLERCAEDMSFFEKWIEPGLLKKLDHVVNSPFETLTYTEAVKLLEASGESFEFPVQWGLDLQSEHERWLTEKKLGRPAFVIDYPKEIKAFYMRQNEDGRTVAAMDLLVPGVGEIIGGSQREEREDVLRARMAELGLQAGDYWWYLELRKYGSVPHSGFGLGFDRALMYVTGMTNIRDVQPFFRTPGHVEF
jgi:asparaginyl-tRNA synthetase